MLLLSYRLMSDSMTNLNVTYSCVESRADDLESLCMSLRIDRPLCVAHTRYNMSPP